MNRCLQSPKIILVALLTLILGLWQAAPANAQIVGATLTGTVTDASGSAIPAAQISIKDVATGVTRTLTADASGFYTAPDLLPASYTVTVSAPGFSTLVRSGLTLTVGAHQQLNLTLQVGQVTQNVEVTGEAPAVQLSSSEMSGTVNQATVEDLPLNGRSWSDLAELTRGVSSVETTESGCGRGCGRMVAVNGGRPTQNNYRVDGISIMDQYNAGPGTQLGGNLGVDAVQEFSVITNNYSAEYGRTSGGVINAVTRSGTNQIHGTAFWYLRDEGLDARNFFDPATIPPFHRNQFGGSVGGPIQKDKTFFFGDYEGIRQDKTNSTTDSVPSLAAHSGILSGVATPVTLIPAIQEALGLFRVPNVPGVGAGGPDTGNYLFGANTVQSENFYFVRVDRTISDKDKADVTYNYDTNPQSAPDVLNLFQLANVVSRHTASIEETHIFSSTVVNSARFGFYRFASTASQVTQILNPSAAVNDPNIALVPGKLGSALVSITGVTSSAGSPGGVGTVNSQFSDYNSFQFYDDIFVTRGVHSLKFGGVIERDQENYINNSGPGGTFKFGSVSAFLNNLPSSVSAAIPGTLSPRSPRVSVFGGYAQDDWRIRPNLTLNLGLRYEMATVVKETNGKTTTLINPTDATPHTGNPYYPNSTKLNFEPRVGFAWDPFKDGKTSVRGGFGMFDVLPLLYEFTSFGGQGTPFYQLGSASLKGFSAKTGNIGPTGCYPNLANCGGFGLLSKNPKTFRAVWIEQNKKRNYVMQYNLDLQRQITPSVSASLGYVGSHGVHQPFRTDEYDMVQPTLTSSGYLWPAPIGTGTRLNTNFGDIRALLFGGESSYNGLVASVEKRMGHGLQIQGAFTWSKSLDTSSSTQEGDSLYNSITSEHWFDLKALNYGPSDFNITRTLIINALWQIPSMKTGNGLVKAVANGWQLSPIIKINDGPPFTPTWGVGGDVMGTLASDDWSYPDRLTGSGCQSLVNPGNPNNYLKTQCFTLPTAPNMAFWQANCDTTSGIYGPTKTTEPYPVCFNLRGNSGRNIANGPGLVNVDMSLVKNNYIPRISEAFNVQFRFDAFNVFNRANFAPPGVGVGTSVPVNVFDAQGDLANPGQLLTTTTSSRQLQLALKVFF
jgi:hypothetical protein